MTEVLQFRKDTYSNTLFKLKPEASLILLNSVLLSPWYYQNFINYLRDDLDISQVDISKESGISKQTICAIKGKKDAQGEKLAKRIKASTLIITEIAIINLLKRSDVISAQASGILIIKNEFRLFKAKDPSKNELSCMAKCCLTRLEMIMINNHDKFANIAYSIVESILLNFVSNKEAIRSIENAKFVLEQCKGYEYKDDASNIKNMLDISTFTYEYNFLRKDKKLTGTNVLLFNEDNDLLFNSMYRFQKSEDLLLNGAQYFSLRQNKTETEKFWNGYKSLVSDTILKKTIKTIVSDDELDSVQLKETLNLG